MSAPAPPPAAGQPRARWAQALVARRDELRLALMLLTRLPQGRLAQAPSMADAAWAFPLAGLAVGLIGAGVMAGALAGLVPLGLPPAAPALLALGAMVLASGALHEDGLADLADGFGGGRDPAAKLAIMRDSRIGSYGVVALILALGLKLVLYADLPSPWLLIAPAMASRGLLPLALWRMAPARADGLGAAAGRGMRPGRALAALALGVLALILALGLGPGLLAGALMLASLAALGALARRQIGGVSGDVLGAMQVTAELVGLLALSVLVTA